MAVRILVVDDEIYMEDIIKLRFRKEIRRGIYEFHYALNGREALDWLDREGEPDIILCDINMPEMNGLALMDKIKERPYLLKIIMITAYGNMENIRAAMNRGAFDFLNKPIEIHDLKATIEKAWEELTQIRAGEEARKQLPITEKELKKTDERARYLEELNQFKSRFFTNISHEFRTPLTVIKGMIQQIEEKPDLWKEKGKQLILRNTNQLLNLVNQILDLQKLEADKLELNLKQGNISAFFIYASESFQSLARLKGISFQLEGPQEPIWMDYDAEKMLRILSNLLSNAIKFTPEGGIIHCRIERVEDETANSHFPKLLLSIKDTGIGIPEGQLDRIFERFYQVDGSSTRKGEGTGIGLSLTKELVDLMDGKITVQSAAGEGTQFFLRFPITQQAPRETSPISVSNLDEVASSLPDPIDTEEKTEQIGTELPRLLIIEDNPDVRTYLSACLEDQYRLIMASDGQEGIDKALEEVPDLIISDVMMPQKDGFEVCEMLKKDTRTSHIPIVLLTAKADHSSKIEGLSKGADAYLAKPFDKEELDIRMGKLLELRASLQARYANADPSHLSASPEFEQEDKFVSNLFQILEEQYDNPDFNISVLCKMVGLSRSSLHRKVTALTNKSVTAFLKEFRIKKAYKLLMETKKTVAEIAYEVGFSDPSYFNRVFSLIYGISPNKFRRHRKT